MKLKLKQKYMKTKVSKVKFLKKSLGLLGIFAGAGLACGVLNYLDYNQQINVGEQEAELTVKLVESTRINTMIRLINSGRADEVSRVLNSQLADNLKAIPSLAAASNANGKRFAQEVTTYIAHDEKKNPAYYLAANRAGNLNSTGVMQVVRH